MFEHKGYPYECYVIDFDREPRQAIYTQFWMMFYSSDGKVMEKPIFVRERTTRLEKEKQASI